MTGGADAVKDLTVADNMARNKLDQVNAKPAGQGMKGVTLPQEAADVASGEEAARGGGGAAWCALDSGQTVGAGWCARTA